MKKNNVLEYRLVDVDKESFINPDNQATTPIARKFFTNLGLLDKLAFFTGAISCTITIFCAHDIPILTISGVTMVALSLSISKIAYKPSCISSS